MSNHREIKYGTQSIFLFSSLNAAMHWRRQYLSVYNMQISKEQKASNKQIATKSTAGKVHRSCIQKEKILILKLNKMSKGKQKEKNCGVYLHKQ